MNLILNTVDTGHQQGSECQVRVSGRIREARFDTFAFRAGGIRNTNRRRAVTSAVSQHDWRFKARHQTLVGVGRRVSEGVQGAGVLDNTANVIQRHFRQASVLIARKLVIAIFPERLVNVHTRTVVAYQRLRHKGGGFAVRVSHVVNHVLHFLNFVSFLHQRVKPNADFVLTCVGNFVVVNLHGLADRFQGVTHSATNVMEAINRRNREVAAFNTRAVT